MHQLFDICDGFVLIKLKNLKWMYLCFYYTLQSSAAFVLHLCQNRWLEPIHKCIFIVHLQQLNLKWNNPVDDQY